MLRPVLAAALGAMVCVPALRAQQPEITRYPLPPEITYPEGIAFDEKGQAIYVGSAAAGAIARLSADGRQAAIVVKAGVLPAEPFPSVLGLKVDAGGKLWVAGGRTGLMAVFDAATGRELKRFQAPTAGKSLINDVAVVDGQAYFTDTFVPTLWRIPVKGDRIGPLEPWLEFAGSPLQYESGANLNGIAATSDGQYLIVVQMNKGLLFRIGLKDRRISQIETGGEALNTGDGLLLDGRTLYLVRQGEQEIVTLELSNDFSTAKVRNRFKDPSLLWPATAARAGGRLLVVSTQFNQRQKGTPQTPFSVVGIPLPVLAGR